MNDKLLGVCLVCMASSLYSQIAPKAAQSGSPVVRQIDHIVVEADTVANAKALWSVFSKTLNLPIAWPPADYKGFFSGGVSLGNVNLELAFFESESERPAAIRNQVPSARFSGLGLEPEPLQQAVATLDRLGVRHGKPDAYQVQDETGKKLTLWTTVYLDELSKNMDIFLCEYSNDIFQADNPPRRDVQDNRRYLKDQLKQRGGGPLGIDSVKDIVIDTLREHCELVGKAAKRKDSVPRRRLECLRGPPAPSGSFRQRRYQINSGSRRRCWSSSPIS